MKKAPDAVNGEQLELPDSEAAPVEQPSMAHAVPTRMIDRTRCFVSIQESGYRIGALVGGSYGQGREYWATRNGIGWDIRRLGEPTLKSDPADIALLRRYLEGPRHVLLVIDRKGGTAFSDVTIVERRYTVADGPDVNDWEAWRAWTTTQARKDIANHYAGNVPSDALFHATAMDAEAADLHGGRGMWLLDRRGVDISP